MKRLVYENLVRVFYSNGALVYQGDDDEDVRDHDNSFYTHVFGKEFIITPILL